MNLDTLKRILILRLSSLGDIILTTPLIRALKKNNQALQIDFLIKEQYKDVLNSNPYLSNLFEYKDEKSNLIELTEKLRNRTYDLIIDLQNNFRSKKIRSSLKAKSIGFNKRDLDKLLLVHFKINRLKGAPPIPERYTSVLNGVQLDGDGMDLFTNKIPSQLFHPDEKYVGFCPGSKHFTKKWPKEYFIHLGNLLKKIPYNIALFGGEEDKNICREISAQIPCSLNLNNNNDILQTAADMKMCDAIVCNDSGLMHAACALKIPVLVFFGSTVKEFGFTPYQNKSIIMENNSLSCRPCTHIGRSYCPKGHFKCMLELTPGMAFNKIKSLLNN